METAQPAAPKKKGARKVAKKPTKPAAQEIIKPTQMTSLHRRVFNEAFAIVRLRNKL
jgi:hypothetical protein